MRKNQSRPLPALSRCEEVAKLITTNAKLMAASAESARILGEQLKDDAASQE